MQIQIKAQEGTVVHKATVTSDSSGTYHYVWTAPEAGEYKVIANFEGTQSYGPSSATTAFVINAPTPSPTPIQQEENTTAYLLAITGIVIALLVIVAALTVLLAKRKIHP